jgi:hypothetical protein
MAQTLKETKMVSSDGFFAMWEQYNNDIWPMQIVTYVLGILSVVLALKKQRFSDKAIAGALSLLWLWNGLATFIITFGDLSAQYYAWGALWIVQGLIFLYVGFVKSGLEFGFNGKWYNYIGLSFVAYALLVYPLIGSISGHSYPGGPIFGVAPCPVCIFTVGMLLLSAQKKAPLFVMGIPFLWSLTGIYAVLAMGVYADAGEVLAGVMSAAIMLLNHRKSERLLLFQERELQGG